MITAKFNGFFDPTKVKEPIHIIGCGAIGSNLALNLTRCGLANNLVLWDFDTVQPHNLANQQYGHGDIGDQKARALVKHILRLSPQSKPRRKTKWDGDKLDGYIFLAVDSIETRKAIVNTHMYSTEVKAMFDFRMRLKDAQHFATDWSNTTNRKNFFKTMDFTSEEAQANTEVNACNMSMSIIPTVDTVCAAGIANFINHVHGVPIKPLVMVNPFSFMMD